MAVRHGWISSYKFKSDANGTIANNQFFEAYTPTINELIQRSDVLVAYVDTSPDVVIGFLATEGGVDLPVVHYVYVKKDFRRNGVANFLFKEAGINTHEPFYYTFQTRFAKKTCYEKLDPDIARDLKSAGVRLERFERNGAKWWYKRKYPGFFNKGLGCRDRNAATVQADETGGGSLADSLQGQ